jgi:serine/threonine-protein kinase
VASAAIPVVFLEGKMAAPGEVLALRYRIEREIGRGSMGVVYEGHDERLDRRVAIKLLEMAGASDERLKKLRSLRFEREAQAVGRVGSAHVLDIYDLGALPNGDAFMVLEYLEGENLKQRLDRVGALLPRDIAVIACELLDGLHEVHEVGIIHRDVKPANVFLVRRPRGGETVKILDFGVCKLRDSSGEATGLGAVLGSVPYMAPEFIENGPRGLDARADLYAVGVLLYRAASGRLPYRTSNPAQLRFQMRQHPPPALCELVPELDPAFSRVVERAMAWDPAARFSSAAELRAELLSWLDGQRRVDSLLGAFVGTDSRPKPQPRSTPARQRPSSHPTAAVEGVAANRTFDLSNVSDPEK